MPVSRRWPKRAPRGDTSANCDVCGVLWRRSQLVRKVGGSLVCPDDAKGRDAVELSEGNSRAAEAIRASPQIYSGGSFHQDDYSDVVDVATVVDGVTFGNGSGH